MTVDPGESNNLSSKIPDIANQMRNKLREWTNDVNAKMPKVNKVQIVEIIIVILLNFLISYLKIQFSFMGKPFCYWIRGGNYNFLIFLFFHPLVKFFSHFYFSFERDLHVIKLFCSFGSINKS